MREAWIPLLRCPVTGTPYDVDATRSGGGEIQEGFLVARGGREVRPIVAGIPVLPPDLAAHLKAHGTVYERMPLADSRVVRFVLGRIGRKGTDFVPFEEVIARYGDLVPPGTWPEPPELAPADEALARALAEARGGGARALDVGCGVGRGVFVLLGGGFEAACGVDRSVARVRRAHNVAVTRADFFLPAPPDSGLRQVPIELDRLDRRGAEFAVAAAEALPFADGAFDAVLLRRGDGLGPWDDPGRARAEAERVLGAGGLLLTEDAEGRYRAVER